MILRQHIVQQNECLAIIASRYGFHWLHLWELPENAELKSNRKNPNVLLAGDIVMVPEKALREEIRPTDQTHRFVLDTFQSRIRIRLLDDGEPRKGLPYTFEINDRILQGNTDEKGELTLKVPPETRTGLLRLLDGEQEEEYELTFGQLDPIEDIRGTQQRLGNLGYECEATGELDEDTINAITTFREARKISQSSDPMDDIFLGHLAAAHGS